jgi:hypothetical protein
MKIKIIVPIYPFDGHKDFMYPETLKTPVQQVEWLKEIVNDKKITSKDELVVITTSPYIAEGLCKITKPVKKGDNFGEKEEVVFSDGKNDLTSEQFFHHFADAMRLLFDDITPSKKCGGEREIKK